MSYLDFESALHQAREASRELDRAALLKGLDPARYEVARVQAGKAFDQLVLAVRAERDRIYRMGDTPESPASREHALGRIEEARERLRAAHPWTKGNQ